MYKNELCINNAILLYKQVDAPLRAIWMSENDGNIQTELEVYHYIMLYLKK